MFFPSLIHVLIQFGRGDITHPFTDDYLTASGCRVRDREAVFLIEASFQGYSRGVRWKPCPRSERCAVLARSLLMQDAIMHVHALNHVSRFSFILQCSTGGPVRVWWEDRDLCSLILTIDATRWSQFLQIYFAVWITSYFFCIGCHNISPGMLCSDILRYL